MIVRLLVCGERNFEDREVIDEYIVESKATFIINGAAPGADLLSSQVAQFRNIPYREFPANWSWGKRGGPIRNKQMLDEGEPDQVVAFFVDRMKSRGTTNMVLQANRAGVPVDIFEEGKGWLLARE